MPITSKTLLFCSFLTICQQLVEMSLKKGELALDPSDPGDLNDFIQIIDAYIITTFKDSAADIIRLFAKFKKEATSYA